MFRTALLFGALVLGPGCLVDQIPSDRYADATWHRRGALEPTDGPAAEERLVFHVDSKHLRVALEWSSHGGDTCGHEDGGNRMCGGFRLLRPDGTDALTESYAKGAKSVPHWYEQNAPMFGDWTLKMWAWDPVDYSVGAYF